MTYHTIPMRRANNEIVNLAVALPPLLTNDAGAVVLHRIAADLIVAQLNIAPDAGMRQAGITGVHAGRRQQSAEHGDVLIGTVPSGAPVTFRLANRPALSALADNWSAVCAAIDAARGAVLNADRAEAKLRDDALRTQMHADAAALRAMIPATCIEVVCRESADVDGCKLYDYTVAGQSLALADITVVGGASAIRPGALGAFDSIIVAYVTPERLAAVIDRNTEAAATRAAAHRAHAEQVTREVPAHAVAAYSACGGDPETFADGIDDPSYWLVRQWADAIEHQRLAAVDPGAYSQQPASQAEADMHRGA